MLASLFKTRSATEKIKSARFEGFITRVRMKPVLKNPTLQEHLEKNGYAKFQLPSASIPVLLETINSKYEKFHVPVGRYHHTTYHMENSELSKKIDSEIRQALAPFLNDIFWNAKFFVANLMYKEQGEDSAVPPHQDWNYVDESFYDSMNLWIPLQDVQETNGCLTFLPSSHRICYTLRTAPTFSGLFDHVIPLAKKAMIPVTVKRGEAIVFFHATLHGSLPNTSTLRRANVVLGVYSEDALLSHHYLSNKNGIQIIEKFPINVERFYQIKDGKRPPSDWMPEVVSFDFPQLTDEEFNFLYPIVTVHRTE